VKAVKELSKTRTTAAAIGFLLERVTVYAKAMDGVEKQFVAHPSSWLNDERYNDDDAAWTGRGCANSNGRANPARLHDEARDWSKPTAGETGGSS